MTPDPKNTEPQGVLHFLVFGVALAAALWVFARILDVCSVRSPEEREAMKTHPAVRAGAWIALGIAAIALLRLCLETLQLLVWFWRFCAGRA